MLRACVQDPEGFCEAASQEQAQLREKLEGAAARVASVSTSPELKLQISEICALLDVDGIRGDIVVNRAACALAAIEDRDAAERGDVQRVLALCLNHRWCPALPRRLAEHTLANASFMAPCLDGTHPGRMLALVWQCLPRRAAQHMRRMKKDPLSPIDSGAKVQMAFRRITDPERAKREAAEAAKAKQQREEAAKVEAARAAGNARAGKKAGAWGGL